ncbi:MAG: TRAP transporter permease [Deltaproteobacteria bacterium]|nr:TRAP transporter permease [Deltaproteobacteria bacterium]
MSQVKLGATRTNPRERDLQNIWAVIVGTIAIGASVFHLWVNGPGLLPNILRNGLHLSFILCLTFLLYPAARSGDRSGLGRPPVYDIILSALGAWSGIYIFLFWNDLAARGFIPNTYDLVFGAMTVLLVMEATRRVVGNILLGLAIVFLLFVYFGPYLPGMLGHPGVGFKRMLFRLYLTEEGFFGITLTISSTFIFFFVLFGAFLQRSGASDLFNQGTMALLGHKRGGPGLVAVIASSFMGMLSGSPISNVVTTGSITIPLMKRVGYSPSFAAAIETAASSGGTIMPPVMGFAAFLMAGMLDLPYRDIMLAAILPAIFYYLMVLMNVIIKAHELELITLNKEEMPSFKKVMLSKGHLFIPIVLLLYMLLKGYSPLFAAWWSIVAVFVVTWLRPSQGMRLGDLIWTLESGAKLTIPVAVACAVAGIIIGATTMTGISNTITYNIMKLSGGVLFWALFYIMIATIFMSMALPISACYITVVVLAAPALIELGVPPIVAHFYVLWFASLSGMTPPVALTSYSAASVARADPNRTAFTALKIIGPAFVLPYLFVYSPAVLMQFESVSDLVVPTIRILFFIVAVSLFLARHLFAEINLFRRFLYAVAAILLLLNMPALYFPGMALLVILVLLNWFKKREMSIGTAVESNRKED